MRAVLQRVAVLIAADRQLRGSHPEAVDQELHVIYAFLQVQDAQEVMRCEEHGGPRGVPRRLCKAHSVDRTGRLHGRLKSPLLGSLRSGSSSCEQRRDFLMRHVQSLWCFHGSLHRRGVACSRAVNTLCSGHVRTAQPAKSPVTNTSCGASAQRARHRNSALGATTLWWFS